MQQIEHEIAAVKECLVESRLACVRQAEDFSINLEQQQHRLEILCRTFSYRLSKGKDLKYYQRLMKVCYNAKTMPDPTTLRKQGMLLFVSHNIEIYELAMECLENQTEKLRQYMLAEVSVMEFEQNKVMAGFREKKEIHQNFYDLAEAPLKYRVRVQENVMEHIRSLIQMQQVIRSHSFLLQNQDSFTSYETHDLKQSLSVVSATFTDSFSKLSMKGDQPESLVSLMKQLLVLDGTFPTNPENDEFLENSFSSTDISSAEKLYVAIQQR